jgi:hypothetical protein
MQGRDVKLEDTIQSFKAMVAGEYDHLSPFAPTPPASPASPVPGRCRARRRSG